MTRDRDIERVLDRFYAEGPSEMPDRVYLEVLDRIERVPQGHLAYVMTRLAARSGNLRFAAAAALVMAVVGVGAFAFSQLQSVGPQPTPTPTATALASTEVPAALRYRWVRTPWVPAEAPAPPNRIGITILVGGLRVHLTGPGLVTQFNSTAALVAADRVQFSMQSADAGCQVGDTGIYMFALDSSGTALTLTPVSDPCAPRSAALAGGWSRADCPSDRNWCLGDLTAGSHQSTTFLPFANAYGTFSYTVPTGWANLEDCSWCYVLAKQGAPENQAVHLFTGVVAHIQDDACSDSLEPGVGTNAAAITDWLTSLPGLVATTPIPVTVGSLSGFIVDLFVAPDWSHTCPYSNGNPIVPTLTDLDPAEGWDWAIAQGQYARYYLLDLGNDRTLLIDVEANDKASFDALVADATPIIETFTFSQ